MAKKRRKDTRRLQGDRDRRHQPALWADAAKNGSTGASKTLRDLRVAEVDTLDVKIEGGKLHLSREAEGELQVPRGRLRNSAYPSRPPRRARGPARRQSKRSTPSIERSQVSWRLASWRVAAMPCARSSAAVERAVQVLPGLAVADAAHRRQRPRRARSARAAAAHLVAPARPRASRRSAARCARAAPRGRDGTSAIRSASNGERRRARRACSSSDIGLPVMSMDLERALDALRVGGLQPRGGVGIDLRAAPHAAPASRLAPRASIDRRRASPGSARGSVVQALGERLEVQHRAADQQRHAAARGDLAHQRASASSRKRAAE